MTSWAANFILLKVNIFTNILQHLWKGTIVDTVINTVDTVIFDVLLFMSVSSENLDFQLVIKRENFWKSKFVVYQLVEYSSNAFLLGPHESVCSL